MTPAARAALDGFLAAVPHSRVLLVRQAARRDVPGVCVENAYCSQYTTTDGRFYAKNFASYADAKAWTAGEGIDSAWIDTGHCDAPRACAEIYAPVCGTPLSTDKPTDFGNRCEFENVVRASAGSSGESKGKFQEGTCADPDFCAVVTFSSSGLDYVYAWNANSEAEAQALIDGFPNPGSTSSIRQGACNAPSICPTIYKPVCGTVKSGEPKTYSNACVFQGAITGDAGDEAPGFSKGFSSAGACK